MASMVGVCRRLATVAVCVAGVSLAGPAASVAGPVDIVPGSFKAGTYQADGGDETQAGAHPFAGVTDFKLTLNPDGSVEGYPRDMRFKLPPGFAGNPLATPTCDRATFATFMTYRPIPGSPRCPAASQVGIAKVTLGPALGATGSGAILTPVYNVEPRDGVTAQLGFAIEGTPVVIEVGVDTAGDYGLDVRLSKVPQALPLEGTELTLWGVPNDPSHDAQRYCGLPYEQGNQLPTSPCPVDVPRRPFLTNPASCGAPQVSEISLWSWEFPDLLRSASFRAPDVTGCDRLRFGPGVSVSGVESAPDAPSGVKVGIDLPQADDPQTGLAPPPLRDVKVLLPEGMTINPGSAGGLEACSDAQLGLGSNRAVGCPLRSKIGTASAVSPVLEDPLTGSVYIRSQNSSDPASGEMFRLAMVLENRKRGLLFKLPGQVRVNPQTGRVETVFAANPPLPVSRIDFELKSGPRAPLATPASCGAKAVAARLSSWGGQVVDRAPAFSTSCTAGLGGFSPTLDAGTVRPLAAAFSPLQIGITKPDGNAPLSGLRMDLPTGLLAKLKGNIGSQVGSVTAFAGPGPNPYPLPGKVFLEGRYGDAPFSLRVVVPAKAGPFDLGEVVVRQKIFVNPTTAAVSIVSDPLPTIVGGVPVRLQRLDVNVDKPGFIVNPTSCAGKQIGSRLSAADGQSVPINVRFQVSDCSRLALKPKLALRLTGGQGQLTDGKHPGLKAVLTQKAGQANLKKAAVKLPLSLALDPDNAQGLCEYTDSLLVDPKCPKSSIVGSATAFSPILNQKLTAPVYFAKNVRVNKYGRQVRTLPNLVLPFRGENGLKLNVIANSSVSRGKLVNTFKTVPDAPVSYFALNLKGGANGILVANSSVCKRDRKADVQIDGHNNKPGDSKPTIKAACAKASKKSKKTKRRR